MPRKQHENENSKSAIRKRFSYLKGNLQKGSEHDEQDNRAPVFYHFDPDDLKNLQEIGREISLNLHDEKEKNPVSDALLAIKAFLMRN